MLKNNILQGLKLYLNNGVYEIFRLGYFNKRKFSLQKSWSESLRF